MKTGVWTVETDDSKKGECLCHRSKMKDIEDLQRIKRSVSTELRELEMKRNKLQEDIESYQDEFASSEKKTKKAQGDLDSINRQILQQKRKRLELLSQNFVLPLPLRILPNSDDNIDIAPPKSSHRCRMHNCFDYSRCSLTSRFPVYIYTLSYTSGPQPILPIENNIVEATKQGLENNAYITTDSVTACLYVAFIGEVRQDLDRFCVTEFGSKNFAVPQVPVIRDHLLSFQGQMRREDKDRPDANSKDYHTILLDEFRKMLKDEKLGNFVFETECKQSSKISGFKTEWQICGTTETRMRLLSKSTFSLIVTPDDDIISSPLLVTRLAESLYTGAVPVILGVNTRLPFDEFIDWTKAAIIWPKPRISELPYLLSTYAHADVYAMRAQGRFLYDTYFSSIAAILDTTLALVRTRLKIPPKPALSQNSVIAPHKSYDFVKEVAPGDAQSEFGIPPEEGKIDSPRYNHNFTMVTSDVTDTWNKFPGPFELFESTPFEKLLPSDAKFKGSSAGFRPVAQGKGGMGQEFQEALGGNVPTEQFTIVMLTYDRDDVMIQGLQRLKGLPYLNKVIVVWNSPKTPEDGLQWPDIGVDIIVIRPEKNSLNNRFLPYNEIDTDAVLSVDDDAHLRHDEILFSFRVWRENKDRIVGFPGRFHSWDIEKNEWGYNSDYCCELSMVLTGAAFFHKYYMYLYTNWVPQVIKNKVDEYMNCEDIAMNFLVSHVTRAPPVKVTSRWTFRCTTCDDALSNSHEHYEERHICINYFAKVFGYMPLLSTQFRTDSILFKTRLPNNKQKCFKYI